ARFDTLGAALGVYDLVATVPARTSATRLGALTVVPTRAGQLSVAVSAPTSLRFGFPGRATVSLHNSGNVDIGVDLVHVTGHNVTLRPEGSTGPFTAPPLDISGAELTGLLGGAPVVPGGESRRIALRFKSTVGIPHTRLDLKAEAFPTGFLDAALAPTDDPNRPDGAITGHLLSAAGDAIPGVRVSAAQAPDAGGETGTATTDADGAFRFDGLGDGTYDVAVGGEPSQSSTRKSVTIEPATRAPSVDLVEAISEVSGTVRSAAGAPLADATVSLYDGDSAVDNKRTDGAGRFSFAVLRSATYRLRAAHRTAGLAGLDDIAVEAGTPRTGLQLDMSARRLTVTVTGPGGALSGAGVRVFAAGEPRVLRAQTDGSGVAVIDGVPAGALEVEATADTLAPATAAVAAGADTATLALTAGATLSGHITGPGGAIPDYAEVIAVRRGGDHQHLHQAGSDGAYAIDSLAGGTYDVWFVAPGLAPKLVQDVAVGAGATQTLDADLTNAGATRALGVKRDGGGFAFGARFSLRHAATGVYLASTFAGPDGAAELGPLPDGRYIVEADLPGAPTVERELLIGSGVPRRAPLDSPDAVQFEPVPADAVTDGFGAWDRPPRESYGIPEPKPFPYHRDLKYLDYLNIHFTAPCEEAQRLQAALNVDAFKITDAFKQWHDAWTELDASNFSDTAKYLAKSAKIIADSLFFARTLASKSGEAIKGGVELSFTGAQALIGSVATLGEAFASGNLAPDDAVSLLKSFMDVQRAKDSTAPQGDLAAWHNDASKAFALFDIAKDIWKLKQEVDAFPDTVRDRGDRYLFFLDRYRKAMRRVQAMTNRLRQIAPNCPDQDDDPNPPPTAQDIRYLPPAPSGSTHSDSTTPNDPNDIVGPTGVGAEGWVPATQDLPYSIQFENKPNASAPAVLVRVEHQLDADVDLDAVQLGDVGWGSTLVDVPSGLQAYHADVAQPGGDIVRVDGALDRSDRTIRWTLASIDPHTGEIEESPTAGFLPPEDGTGRGDGFVTYDTRAAEGVPHGADITAQARIVFDYNDPLDTPVHHNTIDATPPVSSVTAIDPVGCADGLHVSWSGTDAGAGVAVYDVWVSEDGGEFVPWTTGVSGTEDTFTGAPGHTYGFYSVARDAVGLVEAPPASADREATVACDRTAPLTLVSVGPGKPANG
ncbi:MAG: hypothetical protein QOI80_1194, partial [Solirubrobacteraceae bacterium]|nr:hypothetical protein [Solirubrobacteraceae bacterium]